MGERRQREREREREREKGESESETPSKEKDALSLVPLSPPVPRVFDRDCWRFERRRRRKHPLKTRSDIQRRAEIRYGPLSGLGFVIMVDKSGVFVVAVTVLLIANAVGAQSVRIKK